ncbi:UNVERIFIED_CONTAM: hypothetical protein GTU68_063543 [Idotea baltica]|nr:hypothetical protein [Idotea baltica]
MEDGHAHLALAEKLYPICRSITGDGVRESLEIIREIIPIEIQEVPTGTVVFDWSVPQEWNIKDAWIKDKTGKKIVDFKAHNLHILNYSVPISGVFTLEELKEHLYTLPDQPHLIPYRTSYYRSNWGFCITHDLLMSLSDGSYEVFIDSTLEDGHLSYGELLIPGQEDDEILFTAHVCHPSLANDNLSGISVITHLANRLISEVNRYSYRFLFIPGTIGSISWLALNEANLHRIKGGLVASLLGDSAPFHFKKSRKGDSELDRVVIHALRHSGHAYEVLEFIPYGYDERQFCSPGINLAVGNLTRSTYGSFPEYHTSADDLGLISQVEMERSLKVYEEVVKILEGNRYYLNLNPKCEPQLGKRGLYQAIGGESDKNGLQLAMLWVLNYSDGSHSLLDIATKSDIKFEIIAKACSYLQRHKLLEVKPNS